jgi:hypothetical protein
LAVAWLFLPGQTVKSESLLTDVGFAYVNLKLAKDDALIEYLEREFLVFKNQAQKKVLNSLIRFYSPLKILSSVSYEPGSKKPDYLLIIENKRVSRTAQLAWTGYSIYRKLKRKERKIYLAFLNNLVLVSNKQELIKTSLESWKNKENSRTSNYFLNKESSKQLSIVVLNQDGNFTDFINNMEKKTSYRFFPNADGLSTLDIELGLISDNEILGEALAYQTNPSTKDSLNNDLVFLFETVKRSLLAYGFNFEYKGQNVTNFLRYSLKIWKEN